METKAVADMRSLPRIERHEKRLQIINLRESGHSYDSIAAITGLSRTGVFNICKRYENGGDNAMYDAISGRKLGDGRRLSAEQEQTLRNLICTNKPNQLQLPYALWTTEAVLKLIEQTFGFRFPIRTLRLYLSRWGFTLQDATQYPYSPSRMVMKKWLESDYPRVASRAKFEGAEIQWGNLLDLNNPDDASDLSNDGKPAQSMIFTVTNKKRMQWQIFEGRVSTELWLNFMQGLIQGKQKKIFVIWDSHNTYLGEAAQEWLNANAEKIEIFSLPADDSHSDAVEMAPSMSQNTRVTPTHLQTV